MSFQSSKNPISNISDYGSAITTTKRGNIEPTIGTDTTAESIVEPTMSRTLQIEDSRPVIHLVKETAAFAEIVEAFLDKLDEVLANNANYFVSEGTVGEEPCTPAIIVIVEGEEEQVREEVMQLSSFTASRGYQLVVGEGAVGLVSDEDPPRNSKFYQFVESGASIGPEGHSWSGTFGAYLKDEATGKVYGLTCGHNFARYAAHEAKTADEMLELLEMETGVVQPSVPDVEWRNKELENTVASLAIRIKHLAARAAEIGEPPNYQHGLAVSTMASISYEQEVLREEDLRIGKLTEMMELKIKKNRIIDYALIDIIARRGFGEVDGIRVLCPARKLLTYEDSHVQILGRTSGKFRQEIGGLVGYLKVDRFAQRFRAIYATGQAIAKKGDSGGLVIENLVPTGGTVAHGARAVGYAFGAGYSESLNLSVTLVFCLMELTAYLEAKWRKKFKLWSAP